MSPKKNCHKTIKTTNSNLMKGLKIGGKMLFNDLGGYFRILAMKNLGGWIKKGVKNIFSKDTELDIDKNKEIIKRMTNELKSKNVDKKNPIFKDLRELTKTLNVIKFTHNNGAIKEEQTYTDKAKRLYQKIYSKYNQLIN